VSVFLKIRAWWFELLTAVQFLTRLPVRAGSYDPGSLARAVKFFPVVGLMIGSGSVLVYRILVPHLPLPIVAVFVVVYLVAITGCLHEDGVADAVDGFGGGWNREKVLAIMRDSRIGSYAASAVALSLIARILLIASLPKIDAAPYLLAAPVLSRWTTLPLSYFLAPAREGSESGADGQGARIARLTTRGSFIAGSLLTALILFGLLRIRAIVPLLVVGVVTLTTGVYYNHRIAGVTGDCFGATNQLAEIATLLCGVWA
jgi:adenosylcobinamide-GDP ribazoletransferase